MHGAAALVAGGIRVGCKLESSGNSGTLTCNFDVNLAELKRDFSVQYYKLHNDVHPDVVLGCIWVKQTGNPNCTVAEGYEFDVDSISDKIVLRIPELRKEHEGWYMCQVIPFDGHDNATDCKYKEQHKAVKDEKTEQRETKAKEDGGTPALVIVAIVISSITLVALVVGFVIAGLMYRRRRRRTQERGRGRDQNHEMEKMNPIDGNLN
ncbi:hypothetical protein BaRGS_00038543 [Batillaria attramentaria]|uniref:Immunoglobulin subtype domain-containing protein n=1 Tax=Batillaria attramentaria TaxID=370345 RepID=A0ABD0J5U2_9CAEN